MTTLQQLYDANDSDEEPGIRKRRILKSKRRVSIVLLTEKWACTSPHAELLQSLLSLPRQLKVSTQTRNADS